MTTTQIETDYLVIGTGAAGMAFVDTFSRTPMPASKKNWGQTHYCPEISENRQNCSCSCGR